MTQETIIGNAQSGPTGNKIMQKNGEKRLSATFVGLLLHFLLFMTFCH
jgi:hypothetical protein